MNILYVAQYVKEFYEYEVRYGAPQSTSANFFYYNLFLWRDSANITMNPLLKTFKDKDMVWITR
jgi:hypothetical protein